VTSVFELIDAAIDCTALLEAKRKGSDLPENPEGGDVYRQAWAHDARDRVDDDDEAAPVTDIPETRNGTQAQKGIMAMASCNSVSPTIKHRGKKRG